MALQGRPYRLEEMPQRTPPRPGSISRGLTSQVRLPVVQSRDFGAAVNGRLNHLSKTLYSIEKHAKHFLRRITLPEKASQKIANHV